MKTSLRAKIMALSAGLVLLFAVVLLAYAVPATFWGGAARSLEEAESVARTLRATIALHYWGRPEELQELIEAQALAQREVLVGKPITTEERGRELIVVDLDRRVVAHTDRARVGTLYVDEDPENAVGRTIADGTARIFVGRHLGHGADRELAVPLDVDGRRVGALIVQHYYEDAMASALSAAVGVISLALVALLAAVALSYYLSRSLTSRLARLTSASAALASGDLTRRAAVGGEDEIAQLASAFDHMADSLQQREQELEFFFAALKTVAEADDYRTAMGRLSRLIAETLRVPFCQVMTLADDGRHGVLEASYVEGRTEPSPLLGRSLPLDPVPGALQAILDRQLIEIREPDSGLLGDSARTHWSAAGVRAALAVPMVARDVVIGLIAVGAPQVRRFSEREKRLCMAIAQQVAVAVDNARLNQNAKESRNRLQIIIDRLPEGVALASAPDGEIIMANAAAEAIWGHPPVSGARLQSHAEEYGFILPSGEPYPVERLPLARALLYGESATGDQFTILAPNGQLVTHLISFAPLRNDTGETTGAVMVFQDVSRLREADRLREEMVGMMSHDLRAPLTVISGHAQILQRRLGDRQSAAEIRGLEAILTSAQRMDSMIQNLVDSARLQTRGVQTHLRQVELCSLCAGLVERMQRVPRWEDVQIEAGEGPCPVMADEALLERVLINLIGNALKFSPSDAAVVVRLEVDDSRAIVAVSDRGPGIDPKDLPHIFERFYRSRGGSSSEGLGLGLYIARMLVEGMGGRIWVESELGSGSTFRFSLPRVAGARG